MFLRSISPLFLVSSPLLLLLSLSISSSSSLVSAASTCPPDSAYAVSAYNDSGSYHFVLDLIDPSAASLITSGVLRLFTPGSPQGSDRGIYGLSLTTSPPPPSGVSKRFETVAAALVPGQEYDGHGAVLLTDGTICSTPTASITLPLGGGVVASSTGGGGEEPSGGNDGGVVATTTTATATGSSSSDSSTGSARLSCPIDGIEVNTTSYVDDSNIYHYEFNILDAAVLSRISSFVLRLFNPPLPCGTNHGEDDGLWGLNPVTPTPAGYVARYEASGEYVQRCTEYNGHIIMTLKDDTFCTLGYESVDVYELKGTGGSTAGGNGNNNSGSSGGAASSTGTGRVGTGTGSGSTGFGHTGPVVVPPPVTPPGVCPIINFHQGVSRSDTNGVIKLTITFTNDDESHIMDWVDLHVSVNRNLLVGGKSLDAPQYNYRMNQDSANSFSVNFPSNTDAIQNSDYINYFFTYSADRLACDTQVIFYQLSSPPSTGGSQVSAQCPVIHYNQTAFADTNSNSLALTFTDTDATNAVQWVDAHVTIVSSTVNGQFNYRIKTSSANIFTLSMPTSDGVIVPADASISYTFTYFVDGIGCNSDNFAFSSGIQGGPRGACPALTYSPVVKRESSGILNFTFHVTNVPSKDVGWVDLHVTITDALSSGSSSSGTLVPQYNYRMVKFSNEDFNYVFPGRDGVSVPETSYVHYFFTYSNRQDRADCNTEWFQYGAASAVAVATNRIQGFGNGNTDGNTNGNTGVPKVNGAGQRHSFEGALVMSVMASLALIMKNWV